MAIIVPDRYTVFEGDKIIVHYYGFTPNSTAYIAWMVERGKDLVNIYNAAGSFRVSGTGNGIVEITTSQGGREIPPGKYWIYMWDSGGKSAIAGPIVVEGLHVPRMSGTDVVPVAMAAGLGIGSYILTRKATAALAGAVAGGIGGWFLTKKVLRPKTR